MIPYDEVLKELVLALGAALFLANALALFRRSSDAEQAKTRTVARNRPGSPVRGNRSDTKRDLAQAPLGRTVALHGHRPRRDDLGPRLALQLSAPRLRLRRTRVGGGRPTDARPRAARPARSSTSSRP